MTIVVDGRQNTVDKIKTFRDLAVWKACHALTLDVYRISRSFPPEERYGLTSQMRRAAVSVSANITEGFSRKSPDDKKRFYNIAQASLHELKYFLILIEDLQYVGSSAELRTAAESAGKMLYRFMESVH